MRKLNALAEQSIGRLRSLPARFSPWRVQRLAGFRRQDGLFGSRPVVTTLVAASCFLLAVPLTIDKPGQPMTLKADEPAYYLMALSLARDFDLAYLPADGARLLEEFPFEATHNLILGSSDGWRTVHYSKPLAYPLFAAPFAALFGANGMVFFNMALFVAMAWMGAVFLARRTAPPTAAAFAWGLLLLSPCFRYVFWLHPETFNMFGIVGALYWGFENRRRPWWLTALSGALLALPVYGKPMFAAIALPLAGAFLLRRQWRTAAVWSAGFAVVLMLLAAMSWRMTGQLVPYLGTGARAGVHLCEPDQLPPRILEARQAAEARAASLAARSDSANTADLADTSGALAPGTGMYNERTFRFPRQPVRTVIENVGYFLVGRHAGLLPYHPFTGIALALFLLRGRRDRDRWLLLLSLIAVAGYLLLYIDSNWQGGAGFVGNRYFVNVVPAFLFLVPGRIPPWTIPTGFVAAGLFVGALTLAPFDVAAPSPAPQAYTQTLQEHTRNAPLRYLPLEHSLRSVPGYLRLTEGGILVTGREDRMTRDGDWWVAARGPSDILIESERRFDSLVLSVSSPVAPNTLRLRLDGGKRAVVEIDEADRPRLVTLRSDKPWKTRLRGGRRSHVHRLKVETASGALTKRTRLWGDSPCAAYAWNRRTETTFFLGAKLRFLGSEEHLAADVFAARIDLEGPAPTTLPAGAEVVLQVSVDNESNRTWERQGDLGVNIGARWRRASSGVTASGPLLEGPEGPRSQLPALAPGDSRTMPLTVHTPDKPGEYTLEIDLVYEHVAWFADRGGVPLRFPVTVVLP